MKDQGQIHNEIFDSCKIGVFAKVFSDAEMIFSDDGKAVRYVFSDGSVIVEINGQWDYEGSEPFTWN